MTKFSRRRFIQTSSLAALAAARPMSRFSLNAAESAPAEISAPSFIQAKPVWAKGREKEMNVSLGFYAKFNVDKTEGIFLRSTGSTIMKITVNGQDKSQLAGYGPARGPHGWYRVDEWNLAPFLTPGENELHICVAGYNSNSYYLLDQPSFLQAEIVDADGNVIAATGCGGFDCFDLTGIRVQKVQRFSFQRPFIEVYDFGRGEKDIPVELAQQPEVALLPRRVPYPEFAVIEPASWGKRGTLSKKEVAEPWRDRSLTNIGPKLKGYPISELSIILSDEIQQLETAFNDQAPLAEESVYQANDAQVVDFGAEYAGFFALELESIAPGTKIAVTFDEIAAENGDVDFLRLGTCSAILWTFPNEAAGRTKVEAFEPNVARYAKIYCLAGSFKLKKFTMREYAYPEIKEAAFASSDARLDKLFKAGILTFRENSVDAFTDCPHRERAGWLCDSFFTARTAFDVTGKTDVEQVFFENYLLPEKFACLPDGMLPMCYPADHYDGIYIPNWAMWFVMELSEYARRSVDRSTIEQLQRKVEKLMTFFEKYENADGLLEKLPSWVFVEWSAANDFVQDVNYPSNMVYAAILDAAGKLYHKPEWVAKGAAVRKTVIEQSYDGEFFVDHALRKEDGSLEIQRDRTEVCQYFAYFFGTVTPESHPELWTKLLDDFGPNRVKEGGYPEIHKANSFVGNVLRLELLSMAGRPEQLLEESVAYNEYMADRTGTLWENDTPYASCNHGFASHICRVLFRDVLGLASVDPIGKQLTVRFQSFEKLEYARGRQPLPEGAIALNWHKEGGKLVYQLTVPSDWSVKIENQSGLELVCK